MDQAGHGEASGRLATVAEAARRARDTWLCAARDVARIRTVIPGQASPTAVEAGELASWTGRLAYADPQWSPADWPDRPLRPPETLVIEDMPQMVAAAHHACETLTGLACAEHNQIHGAAQAGRILVPTRSLPAEYGIPYPFARAPHERVEVLLARYGRSDKRAAGLRTRSAKRHRSSGHQAGPSPWHGPPSMAALIMFPSLTAWAEQVGWNSHTGQPCPQVRRSAGRRAAPPGCTTAARTARA